MLKAIQTGSLSGEWPGRVAATQAVFVEIEMDGMITRGRNAFQSSCSILSWTTMQYYRTHFEMLGLKTYVAIVVKSLCLLSYTF